MGRVEVARVGAPSHFLAAKEASLGQGDPGRIQLCNKQAAYEMPKLSVRHSFRCMHVISHGSTQGGGTRPDYSHLHAHSRAELNSAVQDQGRACC